MLVLDPERQAVPENRKATWTLARLSRISELEIRISMTDRRDDLLGRFKYPPPPPQESTIHQVLCCSQDT